jgi:hypothetical protein
MPVSTHGGFDLAIELDQGFITQLARLQLDVNVKPVVLGTNPDADKMTGKAEVFPSLAYIWLNTEPSLPGSLFRERSSTDQISIVLDLGAGVIQINTLLRGAPPPVRFDPPAIIPLRGRIEITDRIESRRLPVVLDRANPDAKVDALCALIDFSPDPSTSGDPGGADPKIDLRLDERAILEAPLIILMRIDAQQNGFTSPDGTFIPPGPAAVAAAEKALLDDIRGRVRTAVFQTITTMVNWQLVQPGLVPLQIRPLATDPTDPLGTTALAVRTLGTSLLLLFRTTGPGGDAALVSNSQLAGTASGVTDAMALTVSNRTLIGGVVRGAIMNAFPALNPSDFAPGPPCLLAREVEVSPPATPADPSPSPFTLTGLVVLCQVGGRPNARVGTESSASPEPSRRSKGTRAA